MKVLSPPLPNNVRRFVEATPWRFATTYAATWPHEYVVRNAGNAPMILALARHIFEHDVEGRFYSQVRRYHHEDGKVYWSMAEMPEAATLINRCSEEQTYEARLAAGTLPISSRRATRACHDEVSPVKHKAEVKCGRSSRSGVVSGPWGELKP